MAQEAKPERAAVEAGPALQDLKGKWQIPLLALSLICFCLAVAFLLQPRDKKVTPLDLVVQVESALANANHEGAARLSQSFLDSFPGHEFSGKVQELLGDASEVLSRQSFVSEKENLLKAEKAYRSANEARQGGVPSPSILLKLGRVEHRLGQVEMAIESYDQALQSMPAEPLPIYLAKIEVFRTAKPKPDLDRALKEVESVYKHLKLDGPQRWQVGLVEAAILNERGEHLRAEQRLRDIFAQVESENEGRKQTLLMKKQQLVQRGQPGDAEEIDRLDQGIADIQPESQTARELLLALADTQRMAGQGERAITTLYEVTGSEHKPVTLTEKIGARAFMMHGRVNYQLTNYEKALHWFARTIKEYPDTRECLAAKLAMAETFVLMGELGSAKRRYQEIAPELHLLRPGQNPEIDLAAARQVLIVQSKNSVLKGQFEEALEFVDLEQKILPVADRDVLMRRTQILTQVADQKDRKSKELALSDQKGAQELRLAAERSWREAGDLYLHMAETFDGTTQKEYPDDLWKAKCCYKLAGAHEQTIKTLKRFIKEQSSDANRPQAMLELGSEYEALQQWDEALKNYDQLVALNANTLAGFEGIYRLGKAKLRKGPDFYDQAENEFRRLIESTPGIEPTAIWYQQSLLELGRLMHRRQNYDQALMRLNEYVQRYPQDLDWLSACYLIADSLYQQAGLALDRSLKAERPADKEANLEVRRHKLESAAMEYQRLQARYEQLSGQRLDALRQEEWEGTLLGLAACLFELKRLNEAVAICDKMIASFQDSPAAMPAYVQMTSAYESMGRRDQARAALERAGWTLKKIPDESFKRRPGGQSKQYWENWIKAMQQN